MATYPVDPIAARIIDDLIVLFNAAVGNYDYHAVQRGLDYITQARREHPRLPVTVSLAPLVEHRTVTPSITCPVCFHTSYNPNDIAQRYCGHCHRFE